MRQPIFSFSRIRDASPAHLLGLRILTGGMLRRNSALSFLESIVTLVSYFLVIRHVIGALGLKAFGLWSFTVGVLAFTRVLDITTSNGLARLVAIRSDDEDAKATVIDSFSFCAAGFYTIMFIVAYSPLQKFIGTSVDSELLPLARALLFWGMINLPINIIGIGHLSAVDGIGRADIRACINMVGALVYAICALLLTSKVGLVGLAYAQAAQFTVVLVAARFVLVRFLKPLSIVPLRFSSRAAGENMHYGARMQLSAVPMSIFDPAIRVVLGRSIGLNFLATYDISYKIAGNTRTLLQGALNPFVPQFAWLYQDDPNAARNLYRRVNSIATLAVCTSFGIIIALSPIASEFFLRKISPTFILSTSVLCFAWAIATLSLPTNLFARAAGIFRWSIIGQWVLLGLGVALAYLALTKLGELWTAAAVGIAIVVGNMVAFWGEAQMLSLAPFRVSQPKLLGAAIAGLALTASIMIAAATIGRIV